RLEVAGKDGVGHAHPGALEDVRERRALLGPLDARPDVPFRRVQRAGDLRRAGRRIVLNAHAVPQGFVIDAVPRGARPAPVEDDRPDRHAPILRARANTGAGQSPGRGRAWPGWNLRAKRLRGEPEMR